jgi:hypothetical protein
MLVKAGLAWWIRKAFHGNQTFARLWDYLRSSSVFFGGNGQRARKRRDSKPADRETYIASDENLPPLSLDDEKIRSSHTPAQSSTDILRAWTQTASNFVSGAASSLKSASSSRRSKRAFD